VRASVRCAAPHAERAPRCRAVAGLGACGQPEPEAPAATEVGRVHGGADEQVLQQRRRPWRRQRAQQAGSRWDPAGSSPLASARSTRHPKRESGMDEKSSESREGGPAAGGTALNRAYAARRPAGRGCVPYIPGTLPRPHARVQAAERGHPRGAGGPRPRARGLCPGRRGSPEPGAAAKTPKPLY